MTACHKVAPRIHELLKGDVEDHIQAYEELKRTDPDEAGAIDLMIEIFESLSTLALRNKPAAS